MEQKSTDDSLTLVALGVLAFTVADVSHEALGHGLATLAVGATPVVLTTSYFGSSGIDSKWIPAAGGIANVVVGLFSAFLCVQLKNTTPRLRYFFLLSVAFNLLFAAGYPAYSGIATFGDWAGVIAGLSPSWLWRSLLVLVTIVTYYLSLRLLAVLIQPFCGSNSTEAQKRLRRITLIPYIAAMILACLGGVFNPMGWLTMFSAALPAAAAAFGLTQLDNFPASSKPDSSLPAAGAITCSPAWIAAAILVAIFFIAVLGPGIKFTANH
jgi:hypothetical protein